MDMTIKSEKRPGIVVDPLQAAQVINKALARGNRDSTPYLVNALKLLGQSPPTIEDIERAQTSWKMFSKEESNFKTTHMQATTTFDRVNLLWNELTRLGKEELHVLAMNKQFIVLAKRRIAVGNVVGIPATPTRDVFLDAFLTNAEYIVLYHNHCVGDCYPSKADKDTTLYWCREGKHWGIEVLDHIIIGDNKWFSMRDAGLLPNLNNQQK